jgi:hypothetical protein
LNPDINHTDRKKITIIQIIAKHTLTNTFPDFDLLFTGFVFFCEERVDDVNAVLLAIINVSNN